MTSRTNQRADLRRLLLNLGGKELVWPGYEEDFTKIMTRGRLWSSNSKVKLMLGEPNQCHENVANLWKANHGKMKICTGYALSDDGLWRQHSWGLWRRFTIIETTDKRDLYFGFVLNKKESATFAFENY